MTERELKRLKESIVPDAIEICKTHNDICDKFLSHESEFNRKRSALNAKQEEINRQMKSDGFDAMCRELGVF